uniref:Uncharacterized protein n=1 Tax=Parascaris equorum TaxID=6256 RepID=A0A914RYH9_PAREQ
MSDTNVERCFQFPRRYAILKDVAKKELAPPMPKEWPTVVSEFKQMINVINTKAYRQYTVRYSQAVIAIREIFFEIPRGSQLRTLQLHNASDGAKGLTKTRMIGRRYVCGYLVPANYVSKNTRKLAAEMEIEDKHNF